MVAYHSHRLRYGRFDATNQIYLITTVTHKRQAFFADFHVGRIIVQAMRELHEQKHIKSLAFVVMPDHIHWLFQRKNTSLQTLMKQFKGKTARQINLYIERNGSVWQAGYHDHALRKEEDMLAIARYIIANPLRAGLVKNVKNYPLWDAVWLNPEDVEP